MGLPDPFRLGVFSALQQVNDRRNARTGKKRMLEEALLDKQARQTSQGYLDEKVRADAVESRARAESLLHPPVNPNTAHPSEPLEVVMQGGQRVYAPRRDAAGMRAPEPQEPLVQTQDDAGNVVYTPRSVAAGMKAKTPGNSGAAAIQTKVAANKTQLSVIDDALRELDAHPEAVGLSRAAGDLPFIGGAVGDPINQRADPGGVAARASLSNIASLKVHDRSGGAVTLSEYPRLAPFIPKVSDTPEAIRIKLKKLRAAVQLETDILQKGNEVAPVPGANPPSGSASAPPSYEEWKIINGIK